MEGEHWVDYYRLFYLNPVCQLLKKMAGSYICWHMLTVKISSPTGVQAAFLVSLGYIKPVFSFFIEYVTLGDTRADFLAVS